MKQKLKLCDGCDEEKVIWKNDNGNKYCKYCWNSIKFKKEGFKPKKQTTIRPKSKKREQLDKVYSQLRRVFLLKHPKCQAALPGCQHDACDIHHKKGRGKWYLVISTWMAVCRKCHMWIETHPIEATDLGFRDSKITDKNGE
jgi:hypothetical protein